MTLQEILQILSGVGLIASLIFVAIQIRNNSRAVRAATFLNVSHAMVSALFNMANSRELTDIVLRGGDDFASLTRLEKARFRFHAMFLLSLNQNVFHQSKIGTLHADDWSSFSSDLVRYFEMPGARHAWQHYKGRFNPEFEAHVDQIIKAITDKVPQSPLPSAPVRKAHKTPPRAATRRRYRNVSISPKA
jgi:hypothetical protein